MVGEIDSPKSITPSLISCAPALSFTTIMHTPQIRCCGCDKVFNPRGHSQHLSKPQNAACHVMHMALRTPSVFQMASSAGSSLASNSNPRSCDDHGMDLRDKTNGELYISIYVYHADETLFVKSPDTWLAITTSM